MLVLRRELGQRVAILLPDGRQLNIQVVEIGKQIRLGFDGPRDIVVMREEVIAKMAEAQTVGCD